MHDWLFILECAGLGLCGLVLGFVYFQIWFHMLYETCQIRPHSEAITWFLVVFFGHLPGMLVFYFFYLDRRKQGRYDLSRLDHRSSR